jgi:hypothetical protein
MSVLLNADDIHQSPILRVAGNGLNENTKVLSLKVEDIGTVSRLNNTLTDIDSHVDQFSYDSS